MATDTAARPTRRPAPDPTRNAWQIPLFLAGAGVFVSAWQGWLPLGTPDPAADFKRELEGLRITYEKVSPDRDELRESLTRIAANVDAFPQQGPLARFTLGSGYVRLAELTGIPEEARGHWALAKQHFELLRPEDLRDPADPPKLAFRLAKARAAIGWPANTPPADLRLQMAVLSAPPLGEQPGDASRLQADLALQLSPPDLHTASESLKRYVLTASMAAPAASLARAKYVLGDIALRRNALADARKWLEQVGSDAPEAAAPGRFLLARVRMKEEDWLGAVRDLDAVRAMPGVPPALKLTAAYHLGFCKLNTAEPAAAARLFEEAVKAEPPEGIAASVRLAELYLQSPDAAKRTAAVDLLAGAVKAIPDPREYRNPHMRMNELRSAFELAIATLLKDGNYEATVQVAETYKAVAENGRDREKRAEALAAWAAALQKSNGEFKPKALAAAEEYQGIVAFQSDVSAKANLLRRAAGLYLQGGSADTAVSLYREATRLPKLPEAALGPVWAELADALVATGQPAPQVLDALNQAMASAGATGTATRYRLARQFADSRRPELAPLSQALFNQIAKQETVSPTEQEFHERALVELAHDHIRSANYPEAEVWLRKQLTLYGTGAEAPLGRLLLGVCLIQRASAQPANPLDAAAVARQRDEAAKLCDEALKFFKQTVAEADAKLKRDGKLNDRDAWLRLQAALRVLQTYQRLTKPNDLLAEAAELRRQYSGTVEELIILSLMYHAFNQKGETGRKLETREQMKELFDRLPPALFTAEKGEYSRIYWEQVWFTPEPKQ